MHDETYCNDLTCSCHYDAAYHADVTDTQEPTEEELDAAYALFGVVGEEMEGTA